MFLHLEAFSSVGGTSGYLGIRLDRVHDDYGYRIDGFTEESKCFLNEFAALIFSIWKC